MNKKGKSNTVYWIIGIVIVAVIIGFYMYKPTVTPSSDGTGIQLHLYDSNGNEIQIPSWFTAAKSTDFEDFSIVRKSTPPTCTARESCTGYATNPNIQCWNGLCSLTNVASMTMAVSATNTFTDVTLTGVHVESATPTALFSALPTTSYTMLPGDTKSWTSSAISVAAFEGTTTTFSATVSGVSNYDATTKTGTSSMQLQFAANPTGGLTVQIVSPI